MSDDQKTPGKRHLVGHMRDATGRSLAVSADEDAVILRWAGQDIRLRADERDPFMRLFMTAEREAGVWTAQNPDADDPDVVTAGIWCGVHECVNTLVITADHLWAESCRQRP